MEYLAVIPVIVGTLLWYLLQQKDSRQQKEIEDLAGNIKKTAEAVSNEREKAAALVMSEKEKLANLVKIEHDRLALVVKSEHDKLREDFVLFRIKMAEEYTTTSLLEKVLKPIIEKLDRIESLLPHKLDRREFDAHKNEVLNKQ